MSIRTMYSSFDRVEKGYLMDTCLAAQDKFKKYLEYFKVPYKK